MVETWLHQTEIGKPITRAILIGRLTALMHHASKRSDTADGLDECEELLLRYLNDSEITLIYKELVRLGIV